MLGLLAAATRIAGAAAGASAGRSLRRAMARAMLALAAVLLLVLGLGFLLSALWIWIAARQGGLAASLWIAGGAIACAIILVLALSLSGGGGRRKAPVRLAAPEGEDLAQLAGEARAVLSKNIGAGLLAAFIAGLVIARKLK